MTQNLPQISGKGKSCSRKPDNQIQRSSACRVQSLPRSAKVLAANLRRRLLSFGFQLGATKWRLCRPQAQDRCPNGGQRPGIRFAGNGGGNSGVPQRKICVSLRWFQRSKNACEGWICCFLISSHLGLITSSSNHSDQTRNLLA